MSNKRAPWLPWRSDELKTLFRCHAEGKTNAEIYTQLPGRTYRGIDAKMRDIGLERNLAPIGITKRYTKLQEMPPRDPWVIKVKFEDVRPETIEREWPTGKFWSWQHLRKAPSTIGNLWQDMVY